MRRNALNARQLLESFLIYLCGFCLLNALIEKKLFTLRGVWPAIRSISLTGLIQSVTCILAVLALERFETWRRERRTGGAGRTHLAD